MFFLETERLGFKLWSGTDLNLAIGLWGDPEVTGLIGGPFSEEQIRERLAAEIANMKAHRVQYWPIFLLSSGEHVGCCGLRPYKLDQRIYEIGFHLRRAYQGQGLAREAAYAVMEHAFKNLKATALFAGHHPKNEPSRRALEKLGFRYINNQFYAPTGLDHPSYLLTAEEFFKRRREDSGQ
ncbi:MAG: GNAT family N-acetyltransferase [candidate division Zixibacteria bacterium]|nr:GNAT family N-acetyltransferase [candidate division Zixibacteria bacterium]